MADCLNVISASAKIHDGKGQLVGYVISTSDANAKATFYDNTAGSGTKIGEVIVAAGHPAQVFFKDPLAPRFVTGLYLALAANMTATVWTRLTG